MEKMTSPGMHPDGWYPEQKCPLSAVAPSILNMTVTMALRITSPQNGHVRPWLVNKVTGFILSGHGKKACSNQRLAFVNIFLGAALSYQHNPVSVTFYLISYSMNARGEESLGHA